MICMPPRHGKSELASKRFPAYVLGREPHKQFIAASYNSDLATDFGREVRNIVQGGEYRALFETQLAQDSRAANRWNTNGKGSYVAAGVCTAVTGRGANILLIDDPVKDREEAESELRRQRVWDWYTSTAYTRLAPGGAVILIQTRWHEDDLAGRLLEAEKNGSGDKWTVLDLPALSDDDKALWPEQYSKKALERIRSTIGPRDWSALYQQRPAPDEGAFFKRDWVRWYDEPPAHLYRYGASDYAVTDKGGDWTVHFVAGVDADDNLYLLDVWRKQTTADAWIDGVISLADEHKTMMWAEESGQIIKSVGPFLEKRMNERKVFFAREQFASAADKPTRARSLQALMASGKVYFPRSAPWVSDLVSELLTFPAGKHDDQVDALSLLCRMLEDMVGGAAPEPDKPPVDRWDKAFDDMDNQESWRTL